MNGPSKPNQVGKDIGFIGSFYNGYGTTATAVLPHRTAIRSRNITPKLNDYWMTSINYCENLDKGKNWILPNIDEVSLMLLNAKLMNNIEHGFYWSRSPFADKAQVVRYEVSSNLYNYRIYLNRGNGNSDNSVRCVRRTDLR